MRKICVQGRGCIPLPAGGDGFALHRGTLILPGGAARQTMLGQRATRIELGKAHGHAAADGSAAIHHGTLGTEHALMSTAAP